MNQLERKVDLQVSAHSGQEDLDLDRVGDDDTQEVVGVPGLGDGRAGQVRFVAYLENDESSFLPHSQSVHLIPKLFARWRS